MSSKGGKSGMMSAKVRKILTWTVGMAFAGFFIGSKTTSTGWGLWRDELPPTLFLACVGLLLGWILSRKISK
jgi:hypothetical protein